MLYGYDICPKCKDKLIKRIQKDGNYFERYGEECIKCGNRLRLALTGEKEIDDTIYKITLNSQVILDKDRCIQAIMQVCGCEERTARDILKRENGLLFEGDVLHTYLSMQLLDMTGTAYNVYPKFPFIRQAYVVCPNCGSETSYKIEETDVRENDTDCYMQSGFFCEKCNQWVAMTYRRKIDVDETKYKLEFCLENTHNEKEAAIKKMVDELPDKRIISNKIIVCDNACNIHQILQALKTLCIDYDINPPYPHRIAAHKKEWTEEDLKILMEMNPGLTVTVEEMNALS